VTRPTLEGLDEAKLGFVVASTVTEEGCQWLRKPLAKGKQGRL